MAKDPVCGTYYFCSAGCKATFEKSPDKYAGS
ncbi:MAG: YHS domain-containing protein [Candidatus Rokubacteria bacterium]|nr:YHS domain-containing protein [Candidatus Rokubacteria bacterium]MBI2878744.1 YHS domain-containing protein [Candidatus Rokubacteria bacterium]